MYLIEKIPTKIGHSIAVNLNLDKNNEEVITYGAIIMFQTLFSISLVLIFGFIFNVFIEALLLSLTGSILRKYSGGVHSASPYRCAVIGAAISVGLSITIVLILKYIPFLIVVLLISIALVYSYFYICKYAPVDSPQKPIKNISKKKRLKKISIILITIMYIIIGILLFMGNKNIIFLHYGCCIAAGVVWQTFSLTNLGHKVLHYIDSIKI